MLQIQNVFYSHTEGDVLLHWGQYRKDSSLAPACQIFGGIPYILYMNPSCLPGKGMAYGLEAVMRLENAINTKTTKCMPRSHSIHTSTLTSLTGTAISKRVLGLLIAQQIRRIHQRDYISRGSTEDRCSNRWSGSRRFICCYRTETGRAQGISL